VGRPRIPKWARQLHVEIAVKFLLALGYVSASHPRRVSFTHESKSRWDAEADMDRIESALRSTLKLRGDVLKYRVKEYGDIEIWTVRP